MNTLFATGVYARYRRPDGSMYCARVPDQACCGGGAAAGPGVVVADLLAVYRRPDGTTYCVPAASCAGQGSGFPGGLPKDMTVSFIDTAGPRGLGGFGPVPIEWNDGRGGWTDRGSLPEGSPLTASWCGKVWAYDFLLTPGIDPGWWGAYMTFTTPGDYPIFLSAVFNYLPNSGGIGLTANGHDFCMTYPPGGHTTISIS